MRNSSISLSAIDYENDQMKKRSELQQQQQPQDDKNEDDDSDCQLMRYTHMGDEPSCIGDELANGGSGGVSGGCDSSAAVDSSRRPRTDSATTTTTDDDNSSRRRRTSHAKKIAKALSCGMRYVGVGLSSSMLVPESVHYSSSSDPTTDVDDMTTHRDVAYTRRSLSMTAAESKCSDYSRKQYNICLQQQRNSSSGSSSGGGGGGGGGGGRRVRWSADTTDTGSDCISGIPTAARSISTSSDNSDYSSSSTSGYCDHSSSSISSVNMEYNRRRIMADRQRRRCISDRSSSSSVNLSIVTQEYGVVGVTGFHALFI